jgi:hypothetical protein
MPRYEAYQYFRRGLLFRIRRDGDWVAGAVCQSDQGTLLGQILGVRWGDPQEMKMGVLYALHYAVIRWANEHGYRSLDFLETGPYLESGLFQNKRRWGTTVSVPYYTRRQTWLQARRVTPALAGFLKENPFVIVGLLLGALLPYLFGALGMTAVGRAAGDVVKDVRELLRTNAGIMDGSSRPDYARTVDLVTKAAITLWTRKAGILRTISWPNSGFSPRQPPTSRL